jgi:hypothetical protein
LGGIGNGRENFVSIIFILSHFLFWIFINFWLVQLFLIFGIFWEELSFYALWIFCWLFESFNLWYFKFYQRLKICKDNACGV